MGCPTSKAPARVGIEPEIAFSSLRVFRRQIDPPQHAVTVADERAIGDRAGGRRENDRLPAHGRVELGVGFGGVLGAARIEAGPSASLRNVRTISPVSSRTMVTERAAIGVPALHLVRACKRCRPGGAPPAGRHLPPGARPVALAAGENGDRIFLGVGAARGVEEERGDGGGARVRAEQTVAVVVGGELPQELRARSWRRRSWESGW